MTTPVVQLPDHLRSQIIDHCFGELPSEACGLFAMEDSRIVKIYPTANLAQSPVRFTVPPEAHIEALEDAENAGWKLGGVFHSHPMSEAVPSTVDVSDALDPDWIYVIVGLSDDTPDLRSWSIVRGQAHEVELVRISQAV
ncbi:MAG: M67 family metallopeptidase [Acidimicrobiia bacterium]